MEPFYALADGTQFQFQGKTCVKIPLLHTKCDNWSFIANFVYVEESEDNYIPPNILLEYIFPDTKVQVIK